MAKNASRRTSCYVRIEISDRARGGAEPELPFRILVLGDYTLKDDLRPIYDRHPIDINKSNFDSVMQSFNLSLDLNVRDRISREGEIAVSMKFGTLKDFRPESIAQQVPKLRNLVEVREGLKALRPQMAEKDTLGELCEGITDHNVRKRILSSVLTPKTFERPPGETPRPGTDAGKSLAPMSPAEGPESLGNGSTSENSQPSDQETEADSADQPQEAQPDVANAPDTSSVDKLVDNLLEEFSSARTVGYHMSLCSIISRSQRNLNVKKQLRAAIDEEISAQVNEVLHNERFQKLESAWRSLRYLVDNTEFRQNIRIEVLNASKQDLLNDFLDAPGWQNSGLFKSVYRDQYNTFGANPYGLLVGNFEFGSDKDDVALLRELARVAAVAKCPFIAGVSSTMFGKDRWSFSDLPRQAEMHETFKQPQYTRWNAFRDANDARYVGLCMPRFLLRKPYRIVDMDVREFLFEEDIRDEDPEYYLWGNAAFGLAGRMAQSFADYGWCTHMVEPKGGIDVQFMCTDPPLPSFTRHPTEILIDRETGAALCNCGLISLVTPKVTDFTAFLDAPSCKRVGTFPGTAEGKQAELRSQLSMSFPYLMFSCRIGHYLKVIWRENIGRVMDADKMTAEINKWLQQYCRQGTVDDKLAREYPLKEILVTVEPVPDIPGMFKFEIRMIPHFKMKGVEVELTMVGQFDPPPC